MLEPGDVESEFGVPIPEPSFRNQIGANGGQEATSPAR